MDTIFESLVSGNYSTSPTTWIFFLAILCCMVLFRKLTRK
jgi:hypothetical protein